LSNLRCNLEGDARVAAAAVLGGGGDVAFVIDDYAPRKCEANSAEIHLSRYLADDSPGFEILAPWGDAK
jgi:hypothetical protein